MFGSKKAKLAPNGEIETLVGKDTQLKGALKAKGTIRIDGDFEGDIDSEHDIIIGESGSVSARINARNVMISGLMKGNIQATGCLELMSSGRLYGDIKANVLIVGEGAVFKGASDMADGGNSASYQDEIVSV